MSISCPKKKTACVCYITIVGAQGLAAVSVKLPAVATKCPDWIGPEVEVVVQEIYSYYPWCTKGLQQYG